MIRILLVGNGVNHNKGCEAIVRGTYEYFNKYLKHDFEITNIVYSDDLAEGEDRSISHVKTLVFNTTKSNKILFKAIKLPIIGNLLLKSLILSYFSKMIPYVKSADIVMSIGGDNFSNDYGYPRFHLWQLRLVKYLKKRVIIWGASIGPFDISKADQRSIIRTLKKSVFLFVVREQSTFDNLIEYGIPDNKIKLLRDPAYLMKISEIPDSHIKDFILSNDFIGMNLSPLIGRYVQKAGGNWEEIAKEMVLRTYQQTNMPILLIPHVDKRNNSDFSFMKSLNIGRENIRLLEPKYSAEELKWIISRSRFFIGCRTHSTIASLSTNVPTLSIAYSVKAFGINNLIFNDNTYVLSSEKLNADNYIEKLSIIISKQFEIIQMLKDRNAQLVEKDETIADELINLVFSKVIN